MFRADDPLALARTIRTTGGLGRLTAERRRAATRHRTAEGSVDELLAAMGANLPVLG
ncbi:hypothetical protein ACFV6F_14960 [Kitasatospora phosalacinea]|uniref:hypothetical protein n=1 Tax=Kitasatospora phosalacinea TaxID=2065 RepID=UPI003649E5A7